MDKENVVIYKLLAWDPPYAVAVALKRQKDQKKKKEEEKKKKKMWYTHNGMLAIKKNEMMPFTATWMDLEGMRLSEIC